MQEIINNSIDQFAEGIIRNLEKVIIGKHQVLEKVVVCLLCEGHLLIEDVPGVGKTMLAKCISKSLGCTFSRIQFTPDMLPSDVTGVSIFNQINRQFEFRPGPILSQVVLADEVNRATPKTQSALLEAMEEKQITVDGVSHKIEPPFMVMATQNPIEYEGTFPLPEAQLDRFFIRIILGYPSMLDEIKILESQKNEHPINNIELVYTSEQLLSMQSQVKNIIVSNSIARYIVELVRSTRDHSDIYLGASPRGSLALYRGSQALAAIMGRDFVIPDDVKALAVSILAHRIVLQPSARLNKTTADEIIRVIMDRQTVPTGAD